MKSISIETFDSAPARVKFAAALAAGAFALLALDAGLDHSRPPSAAVPAAAPAPGLAAPIPIATAADQPGVHNLTYYPEQLAALTSLSSFEPAASAGGSETEPATSPAPPSSATAVKTTRHAEAKAKLVAATAPPHVATTVTGAEPTPDRSVSILGMAVPGSAAVGERAAALRDSVSRWGETVWSAGGRIASLWR
ncbi:hypothetical protein [Rhodoblastus sp.]|uniref:hypothetical protein n=1 Tax=Rhodoblastus sp. TaxID=1962975 RepID=UPI0026090B63|nr:hypothetical protein [Rhodoblastus sp.]